MSALGGFGMMCSAAIGEVAAALLQGRGVGWMDVSAVTRTVWAAAERAARIEFEPGGRGDDVARGRCAERLPLPCRRKRRQPVWIPAD